MVSCPTCLINFLITIKDTYMKNRLLSLLLVVSSLGLTAQTDMFPEYTPESYNIAMNYNADSRFMV